MKFNHLVMYKGKIYEAGKEVPINKKDIPSTAKQKAKSDDKDLSKMKIDELKAIADELDIDYKPNVSKKNLSAMIKETRVIMETSVDDEQSKGFIESVISEN